MKPLMQVLMLWRRRWAWLALGLLVSLASAGAGVALLGLAGGHVALLVMGGALSVGALLQVLGPVRVVLRYLERLTTHAATFRALADLRVWFFRGLARQSAGGLGLRGSGDVAARMVGDVEALDGVFLRIIVPVAAGVFLLPVLGFVLIQGPTAWLGAGAVMLFVVAAFVVPAWAARGSALGGIRLVQAAAALRVTVTDAFVGLRDIRAFGAEERMLAATRSRDDAVIAAHRVVSRRATMAQAVGFLCGQLGLILVLIASGARPVYGVGAVFLTVAAFEVVAGLPRAGALAGNAAAAARRVLDAASGAPAVAEPLVPAPLPAGYALRFEGVVFRWSPDRAELFDGLTLDIPPGSRAAILGPSGAGKSTLAALLLKVAAPQSGRILFGGTDITSLSSEAVRAKIAWLGQATHLFDDTIRANLLLARPDADESALWRALDAAEIGEFVRSLPNRLDTWLGEGGTRASGGQGRRIALARTLLTEAPILILDEPCAGLDIATERAFLTTLNALPAGRTVLLITHRLTGVERLDRIWRLSAGHAIAAAG